MDDWLDAVNQLWTIGQLIYLSISSVLFSTANKWLINEVAWTYSVSFFSWLIPNIKMLFLFYFIIFEFLFFEFKWILESVRRPTESWYMMATSFGIKNNSVLDWITPGQKEPIIFLSFKMFHLLLSYSPSLSLGSMHRWYYHINDWYEKHSTIIGYT